MKIIRWLFLFIVVVIWLVEYGAVYLLVGIPSSFLTRKNLSSFEPKVYSWVDHRLGYPRPHGGFR